MIFGTILTSPVWEHLQKRRPIKLFCSTYQKYSSVTGSISVFFSKSTDLPEPFQVKAWYWFLPLRTSIRLKVVFIIFVPRKRNNINDILSKTREAASSNLRWIEEQSRKSPWKKAPEHKTNLMAKVHLTLQSQLKSELNHLVVSLMKSAFNRWTKVINLTA